MEIPQMLRTCAVTSGRIILHALCLASVAFILIFGGQRPVSAQTVPPITVEPKQGPAGMVLAIDGNGFAPGDGSVLWDGEVVGRISIPRDGVFSANLVTPHFAAPGPHEVTVCAGYPCFTGQTAQRASQTVEISGPMPVTDSQLAYIFTADAAGIEIMQQYTTLLGAYGMSVKPVPMDQIDQIDLVQFDLVIVAANTGVDAQWGNQDQVDLLAKAPRILALGEGGYALLGKIAPALGYPNGEKKDHPGTVTLPNFTLSIAKTPHSFQAFSQRAVPIFAANIDRGINIPKPPSAAVPLAYTAVLGDPTTESVIISQGCRTLWGFNLPPGRLSPVGRALFVNTVFYALGAACDFNIETGCSLLTSPTAIPSGVTLNFDEWTNGTVLGDLYLNSVGVRFENSQNQRAIVYADNANDVGKSHSAPNVAVSSSVFPTTSIGLPMRIVVPPGRSHVGFRLGNGKGADGSGPDIPALITAFDASGGVVCRYSVSPVPASHTLFAGIYSAQSRIAAVTIDYGNSSLSEAVDDFVLAPAQFADDIRICHTVDGSCDPVSDATVHIIRNGALTGEVLSSDTNGYLLDRDKVQFGDVLWATTFISATDTYSLYLTSPAPAPVRISAFEQDTGMTVNLDQPLILHNLSIATQWDLTADAAYRAELVQRIIEASNHLYDFTDGRMALGNVTVYQNYDAWNDADIRMYASNVMRPQAEIGGVVKAITPDPFVVDVSYYPGFVYMGSTWDRTGLPANGGIDPDWSLALAHELGHYLLFLYDTYLSLNADNVAVEIDTCTGSAMGWAYEESNTEFIFDSAHWNSVCADTLANQTLGRTEWATILLWYNDLLVPAAVDPGPPAPPAPLTRVDIRPPSTPTTPLPNQTFSLAYQDGETASKVARGWVISNQRVIDQGRPVSGTTSITLNNAQVGDRFCLFDLGANDARGQFGCEIVEIGDNQLTLRKDLLWAPVIQVSPVASQSIAISVTQVVEPGAVLGATIYPEDESASTSIQLTLDGSSHIGTFNTSVPATSAYVAVYVLEDATEETPRREAIVGYGVGGSGAFGPAHRLGGVPILSQDGQAEYAFNATTVLSEGQYLIWQSMAGSPGETPNIDVFGESYRLLARPASLAESGTLAIRLPDTPPPTAVSAATLAATPELHFWTGSEWVPLASTTVTDPQGGAKLIAKSNGVGVYALLTPVLSNRLYLPAIER